MSKESFKSFARLHPELITNVMNKKTNWQQLYEIYEIYGENSNIWKDYFQVEKGISSSVPESFKDFFQTIKNIDMDSVQKGISNIQKTIGLLQDIGIGSKDTRSYEAKPIYKRFED